jgi:hypothetical protein
VLAVAVAVAGVLLVAAVSVTGGGRATGDPEPGILLVDAATGKLRASVPVGDNLGSGRIGYGYAWSIGENGVVSQVDIRRGTLVRSIAVGVQGSLAVGAGGVWVTDIHSQTLTRIDPVTGNVNLRTPLPVAGLSHAVGNGGIAVYDGSLWIKIEAGAPRLDPTTLHLTAHPGAAALVRHPAMPARGRRRACGSWVATKAASRASTPRRTASLRTPASTSHMRAASQSEAARRGGRLKVADPALAGGSCRAPDQVARTTSATSALGAVRLGHR